RGGDLGWGKRGMFVGPSEEALFTMQPGEIRGPVKTQFGYHIIKLEDVESGGVQSFEEARAELEEEYRAAQAQSAFYDATQRLADLAFSSLTELESVAQAMDLPLRTVRSEEHTSELQSRENLVCRLLLEKKKKKKEQMRKEQKKTTKTINEKVWNRTQ